MNEKKTASNVLLLHKGLNPYGGIPRCFDYLAEGINNSKIKLFFGCFERAPKEAAIALPHCYPSTVFFHHGEVGGFDVIPRLKEFITEHNTCHNQKPRKNIVIWLPLFDPRQIKKTKMTCIHKFNLQTSTSALCRIRILLPFPLQQ